MSRESPAGETKQYPSTASPNPASHADGGQMHPPLRPEQTTPYKPGTPAKSTNVANHLERPMIEVMVIQLMVPGVPIPNCKVFDRFN